MRVHVLQHVPFEGPARIADWVAARGGALSVVPVYDGAPLPAAAEVDRLVVMGGPMGANDAARLPWLGEEKRCIARVVDAGRPVLGVCLGAQLIASALGAAVRRNAHPEIGWFPIEPHPDASGPFAPLFAERGEVFHWHGDTFELPPGAVPLARSEACEHQAFALGDRVVGLQFHLETTPGSAAALIEHCRNELVPGPWVQTAAEMLQPPERFARIGRRLDALLDRLFDLS